LNFIVNGTPGYYNDVFDSIFYCLNDCYKETYKNLDLIINPEIEKAVKALSKHVNKKKPLLEVYFLENSQLNLFFAQQDMLWNCENDDAFFQLMDEINGYTVKYNAVKALGKFKDTDETKIKNLLSDPSKVFELVEHLSVEDAMKWKFVRLLSNSDNWAAEFKDFIHQYLPFYKEIVNKYKESNDAFLFQLEASIKEFGLTYLDKIAGDAFGTFLGKHQYNEIFITTSFFNSISCLAKEIEDKVYVTIGKEFEATLKHLSGEDEQAQLINTFKNLSDKTRYSILLFVLEGEVYSQEIADKFNLSMATVSYHMNYLLSVKLIHHEKRGQKTFYAVNKDTVRDLINHLSKQFKLDDAYEVEEVEK
jgi:DNA-binding transcriptional ArsR family regulator